MPPSCLRFTLCKSLLSLDRESLGNLAMSFPPVGAALPQMPENAPPLLAPPFKPGDIIPWFRVASHISPDFNFSNMAGRYVVLSFLGSLTVEPVASIARDLLAFREKFDDRQASMALVTIDLRDAQSTVTLNLPGLHLFFDFDRRISRVFGLVPDDSSTNYAPMTLILDESLRVIATLPVSNAQTHARDVMEVVSRLPPRAASFPALLQAPVLLIPNIFESALCSSLIDNYIKHGGADSGYLTERDGKTVVEIDHSQKKRADWVVQDDRIIRDIRGRIQRRVVPEVLKAFQFHAARIERYLVACYDSSAGAHFNAHRDNATKASAHRRFSVSLNLNEDYDGGELVFPEFGTARYKPQPGSACIFSSSLLHETTRVTKGKRFTFLPFLYDDIAAKIREANAGFLADSGAA